MSGSTTMPEPIELRQAVTAAIAVDDSEHLTTRLDKLTPTESRSTSEGHA